MFVHDAPSSVDFAKTHRQSKFERLMFPACLDVDAPTLCGRKGDILSAGDLHIVKRKGDGFFSCGEKRLPGRHIRVQTPR